MRGISWLAEDLLDFQEGLCSLELVSHKYEICVPEECETELNDFLNLSFAKWMACFPRFVPSRIKCVCLFTRAGTWSCPRM
jgi:hypothetical protein